MDGGSLATTRNHLVFAWQQEPLWEQKAARAAPAEDSLGQRHSIRRHSFFGGGGTLESAGASDSYSGIHLSCSAIQTLLDGPTIG